VDEPFAWPPPGLQGRKGPAGKRPRPPKPSATDPEYEDIDDIVMAILHAKAGLPVAVICEKRFSV
jgi:hypothetical protein